MLTFPWREEVPAGLVFCEGTHCEIIFFVRLRITVVTDKNEEKSVSETMTLKVILSPLLLVHNIMTKYCHALGVHVWSFQSDHRGGDEGREG